MKRTPSNIRKGHKVLVGVLTSENKNYCVEEFIARVKSLTYQNYDVLIVDNSQSRDNFKRFLSEGFDSIHVKPKDKPMNQILAESHEEIRQYAIRKNYDYLLHLESDIIPPPDVIERLMIHNLAIVSAMYMINFGADSNLMAQKMEHFGEIRETINMKDGADLMMVDGHLKKVFSHGLGCCLLHKGILDKFKFRFEKGVNLAPDSLFSLDTNGLEINKYIDTSIICHHRNSEWIYS